MGAFRPSAEPLARPALSVLSGPCGGAVSPVPGQLRAMSSSKPDSIVIAESSSSLRSAARSVSGIVRAVCAIGDAHHVCLFFVHPGQKSADSHIARPGRYRASQPQP